MGQKLQSRFFSNTKHFEIKVLSFFFRYLIIIILIYNLLLFINFNKNLRITFIELETRRIGILRSTQKIFFSYRLWCR